MSFSCCHPVWVGFGGGNTLLHVVTQGPGSFHILAPSSSRSFESFPSRILEDGERVNLGGLHRRFLWILLDFAIQQTTVNLVV